MIPTLLNKTIRFCCYFFLPFILMSCNENDVSIHKENNDEGFYVDINLKSLVKKKFKDDNYAVIYGDLSIKGLERKMLSANLDCFSLISNGIESNDIYVDSVASFEKTKYLADSNGKVFASVYWTFPNASEKDIELQKAELIIKDAQDCVVFDQ